MGAQGITRLKAAVDALVTALLDTGTVVSVTSFSTVSPGLGGYNLPATALTQANLATVRGSYANVRAGGSTGWQDGLLESQRRFGGFAGGKPDLLLFVTDGNPNVVAVPGGGTISVADGSPDAVNPAIATANQIRGVGVHMFGLAMGEGIQIPVVTGGVPYDGTNLPDAGFVRMSSPDELEAQVRRVVADLAAPSLTVSNWVQTPSLERFEAAEGWDFAAAVTIPGAGGTWVSPPPAAAIPASGPSVRHRATSPGGTATFQWQPAGDRSSSVVVSGQPQGGYRRVPALQCQARQVLSGAVRSVTSDLDADGRWSIGELSASEIATCAARSTVRPRLTLVANVDNGTTGGTSGPGDWALTASGPGTVSGRSGDAAITRAAMDPGTYELSASGPRGYSTGDWVCTGARSWSATTVALADGDVVSCAVTMTAQRSSPAPTGAPGGTTAAPGGTTAAPGGTTAASSTSRPSPTSAVLAPSSPTSTPTRGHPEPPGSVASSSPTPAGPKPAPTTPKTRTATAPPALSTPQVDAAPEPAGDAANAAPGVVASSAADPTAGPDAVYDPASQLRLRLDLTDGDAAAGRGVSVTAGNLQPSSSVTATLYSEPTLLLHDLAAADGSFSGGSSLPSGLAPGIHTVVLSATSVTGRHLAAAGGFALDEQGRVVALAQPRALVDPQPGDPRVLRALRQRTPPYDPKADPLGTAAVGTTAAVVLALVGAGVSSRNRRKGSLKRIVAKRLDDLDKAEPGPGDRGWTWRWPLTSRTDAFARRLPICCATRTSLGTRLSREGAWARAVLGSGGYLLWLAGGALAVGSASRQQGVVTAPPLPILLALVALGLLDASAGAVAWLALCVTSLLSGSTGELDDVRTLLGIGSLLVLPALGAHVMRPVRRPDW